MHASPMSHFKTLFVLLFLSGPFALAQPVQPWPDPDAPPPAPSEQTTATTQSETDETATATNDDRTDPVGEGMGDQGMQILQQLFGSMGGGGTGFGLGFGQGDMYGQGGNTNQYQDEKFAQMAQRAGSGVMEKCGGVPSNVRSALNEAMSFRSSCALAQRGNNQKIAINDYSGNGTPHMYIFDLEGNCYGKTAVTYGNGAGPTKPQPCNDNGSHLTPAGFHLTARHDGARYNASNSVGLVGLEGQNSRQRGVIIHMARAPGTASSWGCTGVGSQAFNAVKTTLGEGSLVYNYFGNSQGPASCRNKNGLPGKHSSCRLDANVSIPAQSTGGGQPATSR